MARIALTYAALAQGANAAPARRLREADPLGQFVVADASVVLQLGQDLQVDVVERLTFRHVRTSSALPAGHAPRGAGEGHVGLEFGLDRVAPGVTLDSTSFSWAATMASLVSRPPGRYHVAEAGQKRQDRKRRHLDIDDLELAFRDALG